MIKRFPFTVLLLLTALALVFLASNYLPVKLEQDLKSKHLKGGDFELLHEGRPFQLERLRGKPLILYFGYTFCPDVCPLGLSTIREVLRSSEDFEDVPALFITVDPERDTKERLKEYTAFFHSNIKGLRGSVDQLKAVSSAYGTFFRSARDKLEDGRAYTVDHSAYFYLLDAQGKLIRVLDHDTKASQISELLHKLL